MTLFGVSVGENVYIGGSIIYGKYTVGDCVVYQATPDILTKPNISMEKVIHNSP
jgi:hypothetical protein